jgi:YidC/Oxa1 family membrane protein insertase
MDLYRAFLAIVISFLILIGYQYFFVKPVPQQPPPAPQTQQLGNDPANPQAAAPAVAASTGSMQPAVAVDPQAKDITVDTPLYTAVIKEQGGGFKSFVLKNYRNKMEKNSGPMQLILGNGPGSLPVLFSLDNGAGTSLPVFKGDKNSIALTREAETATLTMTASQAEGLTIVRTLTFRGDSYLINVEYKVQNTTDKPVPVSPALTLVNEPFAHASESSQFLFSGPAAYVNGELVETKPKN